MEESGEHGRPARHPHALLHHRALLLRRLQARHAAGQPPPGEATPGRHMARGSQGWGGWEGGEGESCSGLKQFTCSCRPGASGSPLKRFMWLFLGAEGLLWSPHVRAAVQPRPFYPHQLDGPRRQRLLLVLQRLRPPRPLNSAGRTLKDGGPRRRDQLSARGVSASNPCYLNPTFDPSCLFQFYLSMSGNSRFCCRGFHHSEKKTGKEKCSLHQDAIDATRDG